MCIIATQTRGTSRKGKRSFTIIKVQIIDFRIWDFTVCSEFIVSLVKVLLYFCLLFNEMHI